MPDRPSGRPPRRNRPPGSVEVPGSSDGSEIQWIWPFKFIKKIGEGGMGVVYKAEHAKTGQLCAVKLLPPDLDRDIVRQRFKREVEILSKLRHPNIVHCFGGRTETDRDFYAMELVDGGNLEDLMGRRGPLAWGEVIELGLPMCAGLAYAHDHGVIHRDLKPGNFLLTGDGKVKLADFGLATVAASHKLTQAGKTLGTLRYMAPEQVRGDEMSAATDLYALGIVFYELLTGRTPFEGDSPARVMQMHLAKPAPDVREIALDCPPELAALIADLLAKDPAARPASAREVARRLKSVTAVTVVEPKADRFLRKTAEPTPPPPEQVEPTADRLSSSPGWLVPLLFGIVLVTTLWVTGLLREAHRTEATVASIRNLLRHENPVVRAAAAEEAGHVAAGTEQLIPELEAALDEENMMVREAAARGLGNVGVAARGSIPKLIKVRKRPTEEPSVREAARDAIERIGRADEQGGWFWYLIPIIVIGLSAIWAIRRGWFSLRPSRW